MDVKSDAEELMEKFRSCAPKKFFSSVEEAERGIGFILVFLYKSDGEVIAGDIAREMNVTTARVAALLKKMEKNGLITRECSLNDGRRTVVKITGKGTDAVVRKSREKGSGGFYPHFTKNTGRLGRMIFLKGDNDNGEYIPQSEKVLVSGAYDSIASVYSGVL